MKCYYVLKSQCKKILLPKIRLLVGPQEGGRRAQKFFLGSLSLTIFMALHKLWCNSTTATDILVICMGRVSRPHFTPFLMLSVSRGAFGASIAMVPTFQTKVTSLIVAYKSTSQVTFQVHTLTVWEPSVGLSVAASVVCHLSVCLSRIKSRKLREIYAPNFTTHIRNLGRRARIWRQILHRR